MLNPHHYSSFLHLNVNQLLRNREDIATEMNELLEEGIIEPSDSPWRAQVVVTRSERHRKRLVIDYSETIKRFTQHRCIPNAQN